MRYCVGASAYHYHVDVGAPVGGVFQLAGCFGGSYTVGDGMEADIVRSRRKCLGFVLHGDELASRGIDLRRCEFAATGNTGTFVARDRRSHGPGACPWTCAVFFWPALPSWRVL